jgi:carboxyl-terminal processing protease
LNHILSNRGGTPPDATPPARTDLPAAAKDIPPKPPENWPAADAAKPDTDFQLQEGLTLVRAMANQRRVSAD